MRVLIGSTTLATAGTAVQLRNDSNTRCIYFAATIRGNNSGESAWLGHSSAVSSAAGWELSNRNPYAAGTSESFAITFPVKQGSQGQGVTTGVLPSTFWMNSSTTTARVDHCMVVVP